MLLPRRVYIGLIIWFAAFWDSISVRQRQPLPLLLFITGVSITTSAMNAITAVVVVAAVVTIVLCAVQSA